MNSQARIIQFLLLMTFVFLSACSIKIPSSATENALSEPALNESDNMNSFETDALHWLIQPNPLSEMQIEENDELIMEKFSNNIDHVAEYIYKSEGKITFFSPYSLYVALLSVRSGLSNVARHELDTKMNPAGLSDGELIRALRIVAAKSLPENSESDGNALWEEHTFVIGSDQLEFHPNFLKNLTKLGISAATADLHSTKTFAHLNEIISAASHGIISPFYRDELITEITQNRELYCIFLNTLYYSNKWLHPFDPVLSKTGIFFGRDGQTKVNFMYSYSEEEMPFLETERYIAVRKPYLGGSEILILMPKEDVLPETFWTYLNEAKSSLEWTLKNVTLSLPQWEQSSSHSLQETLRKMNLDKMINEDTGHCFFAQQIPLELGHSLQKTKIQVDEEGTEAAVATVLSLEAAASSTSRQSLNVDVNRPFVYSIEGAFISLIQGLIMDLPSFAQEK